MTDPKQAVMTCAGCGGSLDAGADALQYRGQAVYFHRGDGTSESACVTRWKADRIANLEQEKADHEAAVMRRFDQQERLRELAARQAAERVAAPSADTEALRAELAELKAMIAELTGKPIVPTAKCEGCGTTKPETAMGRFPVDEDGSLGTFCDEACFTDWAEARSTPPRTNMCGACGETLWMPLEREHGKCHDCYYAEAVARS